MPAEANRTLNQISVIWADPQNQHQPCQQESTPRTANAGDTPRTCSKARSCFTSSLPSAPFHKPKIKVDSLTSVKAILCSKEPSQSTREISTNWLKNITQRQTTLQSNFSSDYSNWSKIETLDQICFQTSKTRNQLEDSHGHPKPAKFSVTSMLSSPLSPWQNSKLTTWSRKQTMETITKPR
jgi:hypothetical protein